MPRKLKIGFVLDDSLDSTDGVQQYIITLGDWLREQGHQVHYLVGSTKRKDIPNIHSLAKNIRVSFNQNHLSIPLPASSKGITNVLQTESFDILHIQMPFSPFLAGKIIKYAPKETKIFGTFHIVSASKLETIGSNLLAKVNRKYDKKFNKILAVSQAAKDYSLQTFGYKTTIIPNVVNVNKFSHKPIYRSKPHIVCLGRFVERKGQIHLIKAIEALQKAGMSEYRVTFAGKGPELNSAKKYVKDNKIENVKFIGFVEEKDKPMLLASADIAVFPSTGGESFGIVLIEAMAAGSRVVLGGNNDGYRTVLTDKSLLIEPLDTVAFARILKKYLSSEELRQDKFNWNKQQINKYSVDYVGRKILNLYYS